MRRSSELNQFQLFMRGKIGGLDQASSRSPVNSPSSQPSIHNAHANSGTTMQLGSNNDLLKINGF